MIAFEALYAQRQAGPAVKVGCRAIGTVPMAPSILGCVPTLTPIESSGGVAPSRLVKAPIQPHAVGTVWERVTGYGYGGRLL